MFFSKGLYAFNKPVDWTSFDVVNWVKYRAKGEKVGHAGTLDPAAEGLLLVAVGRENTSKIQELADMEKEYIFEITFGIITDTYDREGKVIAEVKDFTMTKPMLQETLIKFTGKQKQVPPMYSAVKINGEKLYNLARKGIEVERQPKEIEIKELELQEITEKTAVIRAVCSKGTYIRALCYDIGKDLGMGAFMSKLTRTKIGPFLLDEKCLVPGIEEDAGKKD